MLMTFKCRASPDVLMLDSLAQLLLGSIGKRLGTRGVITVGELDDAIAKLEAAVAADRRESAEHDRHFHEREADADPHDAPIGLAQRAFPFLGMLRAARAAQQDIVWGV